MMVNEGDSSMGEDDIVVVVREWMIMFNGSIESGVWWVVLGLIMVGLVFLIVGVMVEDLCLEEWMR